MGLQGRLDDPAGGGLVLARQGQGQTGRQDLGGVGIQALTLVDQIAGRLQALLGHQGLGAQAEDLGAHRLRVGVLDLDLLEELLGLAFEQQGLPQGHLDLGRRPAGLRGALELGLGTGAVTDGQIGPPE